MQKSTKTHSDFVPREKHRQHCSLVAKKPRTIRAILLAGPPPFIGIPNRSALTGTQGLKPCPSASGVQKREHSDNIGQTWKQHIRCHQFQQRGDLPRLRPVSFPAVSFRESRPQEKKIAVLKFSRFLKPPTRRLIETWSLTQRFSGPKDHGAFPCTPMHFRSGVDERMPHRRCVCCFSVRFSRLVSQTYFAALTYAALISTAIASTDG